MQKYDVELIVWVQVKDQSTSGIAFAKGEFEKDFCWHLNHFTFLLSFCQPATLCPASFISNSL
jgi:hypothetical protein